MIDKVLTAIFGSKHERDVKRMLPVVQQINDLEPEIQALSDDGLRARTEEFRARLRPFVEALDNAKKEVPRDENSIKAAQRICRTRSKIYSLKHSQSAAKAAS